MTTLSMRQMAALPPGGDPLRTTCGVMVGVTFASSIAWGLTGFLLTVNKAMAICGLSAFR